MAEGNRCYLCGGKLRRGVCTVCGLDNERMTRRDYRLNVTTPYSVKKQQVAARKAESMKYAREYKEEQKKLENLGKPQNKTPGKQGKTAATQSRGSTQYKTYQKRAEQKNRNKWKGLKIFGAVYLIFTLIGAFGGCITTLIEEVTYEMDYMDSWDSDYVEESYNIEDEYLWVERELSETGEYYEEEYGNGIYLVGVHIPEGLYTIQHVGGISGSIYIQDNENDIYMNLGFGEESYDGYTYIADVRLYEGAYLEINGDTRLVFSSENAQTDTMYGMENPMDESAITTLPKSDEAYLVGEDISSGMYDIYVTEGWASVSVVYEDGDESGYWYYYLDSETLEDTYKNVILLDGMTITTDYGNITLTPSKWIPSDDYEDYFRENFL